LEQKHNSLVDRLQRWQIAVIAALLRTNEQQYRVRGLQLIRIYLRCSLSAARDLESAILAADLNALDPELAMTYARSLGETSRLALQIRGTIGDFASYHLSEHTGDNQNPVA
jgi:hypothetical protein